MDQKPKKGVPAPGDVNKNVHHRVGAKSLTDQLLIHSNRHWSHFYRSHPKDGEGNIFSLCVSSHLDGGGGGYLIHWWGVPPSQVQVGGYLLSRSRWVRYPCPRSRQGVPLPGKGYPPASRSDPGWRVPLPEQHSVYLLRSRRCASCVSAGRLSCCVQIIPFGTWWSNNISFHNYL